MAMRRHSHAGSLDADLPYGSVGEYSAWADVLRAHREDNLDEAYRNAQALGTGATAGGLHLFRMIEAEWLTRGRSSTLRVNTWLQIESIAAEAPRTRPFLDTVMAACNEAVARLGLAHAGPTLLTILAAEANAPWAPGRHGFCTPKARYAKICLPWELLEDPAEFATAVRHEYAHALSIGTGAGLCPMWFDEAVATVVGDHRDDRARAAFASGQAKWLSPIDLDLAFRADRESERGRKIVRLAYEQSALIGRYLSGEGSDTSLGEVLRRLVGSPLQRLWQGLRGTHPIEDALHATYGFGSRALFAQAYDSLGESSARDVQP